MITIRNLKESDRVAWDNLRAAYLAFYETTRDADNFDLVWARIQDPSEELHAYGAERDGVLIGFVHFLYHRTFWEEQNRCYLNDLYVAPDARGSGAGQLLIEAVYEHAKAYGAPQIYWLTQEFNETARKLYDKLAVKTPFIKYAKG